jgi:hypothetical protein
VSIGAAIGISVSVVALVLITMAVVFMAKRGKSGKESRNGAGRQGFSSLGTSDGYDDTLVHVV